jgi:hypothetical protein
MITTEWGSIITLQNKNNQFSRIKTTIDNQTGWWNSITAADIDKDGDLDYMVGNYGQNGYLKPSSLYPIKAYAKDFDKNTSFDAVFSTFLPSVTNGPIKEFPIAGRDELIREMSVLKERFPNYASYAKSEMQQIFSAENTQDALQLTVNNFNSSWIENKGNFNFVLHDLPRVAQFAPIYGIVAKDFDGDGNIDLALNGNEFAMSPSLGRYDAFNGLILKGDGKGNFKSLTIQESGLYIPQNGKALATIMVNKQLGLLATQNRDFIKLFLLKKELNHSKK